MAARSWAGSTLTAIGVAAGVGAAQLGIGYGLAIIAWVPQRDPGGDVVWLASLAWVVWVAASSAVLGAVIAHWLTSRTTPAPADSARLDPAHTESGLARGAWRLTLAVASSVGALVTVALVAIPSRAAERADNFAPQVTAGGYAVVGVIVGLVVATAALSARAVTANVLSTVAYIWALAVVAVIDGLNVGTEPGSVQLAIWRFSEGPIVRGFYVPGVLMMLGAALLIGALAAWPAGRRGDNRVGVAISGAAGPVLVASAYLLAAPQLAGEAGVDDSQWSAYLFAPYAVIAGLAGSVAVVALTGRDSRVPAKGADKVAPGAPPPPDDDLTDWHRALADAETRRHGSTEAGEPVTEDLEADSYAPARAYGEARPDESAYVSDTVDLDAKPASARATVKDPPAPSSRQPLWPQQAPAEETPAPKPKGRGRRGGTS